MSLQSNSIKKRKIDHARIILSEKTEPVQSAFHRYTLPYQALPEIDFAKINTGMDFFNKKISMPFMISSMTGGTDNAGKINRNLALACEQKKIPLALGSMRIVLKNRKTFHTFDIRKLCPSIPVFVNLGIVQLNYGYGEKEINKLLDLAQADGIFLHINHLQEILQPEGDVDFSNILPKLEKIIKKVKKPVLAKEVGSGIDGFTAERLFDIGVQWIDTAGLGGTNWTMVEGFRGDIDIAKSVCDLGIQTTDSILELSGIKGVKIIAGGGIRSGVDIAKSIALGASMASAAKPFLEPALKSKEAVAKLIEKFHKELKIAMFASGVSNLKELSNLQLKKI